jgi:hypothetical protein
MVEKNRDPLAALPEKDRDAGWRDQPSPTKLTHALLEFGPG